MKKVFIPLLCLLFLFGCSSTPGKVDTPTAEQKETTDSMETVPAPTENVPMVDYEIISCHAITWVSSTGRQRAQVIIEVENTGETNLYCGTSSYDLEDNTGSLITSNTARSNPSVFAPGEKTIIYDEIILDTLVEGEINVVPHLKFEETNLEPISYPVTDFTLYSDNSGYISMKGRVENTTEESAPWVDIYANLYDERGLCIGQLHEFVSIEPGDKVGFDGSSLFLMGRINVEEVASYVVFATEDQFQY